MHKSIFERFIPDPRTQVQIESDIKPSKKIITPANAMTVGRPAMALLAAKRLKNGEKGAFWPTAITGALDMDGKVARTMDRYCPQLERGTTEIGAKGDTYADASALLFIGGAILMAPRVPMSAKLGVTIILGQEGAKVAWALSADQAYKDAGSTDHLYIPPTMGGKAAMAEKFSALAAAAAANDVDNLIVKQGLGLVSLDLALTGSLRGNEAVGVYKQEAAALIRELQTNTDMANLRPLMPLELINVQSA